MALTSCGTNAKDSKKEKTEECCAEKSKADDNACCDSTKVGAESDSTKKAGCCSEGEKKEPCSQPCEHNHN